MPTPARKHSYKHYFPFVLFSDWVRQFASMSAEFVKSYKRENRRFNRKHFTGNFPPFTYYFLMAFLF